MRYFALILWLPMLLGASGAQTPKVPPHDPAVYGRRLECQKVEGVKECMAVEVVGDRLYAAGGGTLYVFDIAEPAHPVLLGKLAGLGTTRQLFVKDGISHTSPHGRTACGWSTSRSRRRPS